MLLPEILSLQPVVISPAEKAEEENDDDKGLQYGGTGDTVKHEKANDDQEEKEVVNDTKPTSVAAQSIVGSVQGRLKVQQIKIETQAIEIAGEPPQLKDPAQDENNDK